MMLMPAQRHRNGKRLEKSFYFITRVKTEASFVRASEGVRGKLVRTEDNELVAVAVEMVSKPAIGSGRYIPRSVPILVREQEPGDVASYCVLKSKLGLHTAS
jgi:hypothetical protein